jgi:hypothetical protein
LDAATRNRLEKLALERLAATADDGWSFLFRTEGAVDFLYCPWSVCEDWDFDGDMEGLALPWTSERRDLIRRGEIDPDDEELRQWRRALCRKLADGTDWSTIAWVVPLVIDQKLAGYALFLCGFDTYEAPALGGVFDSIDDAEAALADEGAIAGPPEVSGGSE